jgi:hypothetical protein
VGAFRTLIARLRFNRTYSRQPGMLVMSDDGLTLRRYRFGDSGTFLEDERSFAWADVRTIHAYKVETYVVDQIRLLFTVQEASLLVTEGMVGFAALTESLPQRFPGVAESWMITVAFPAFQQDWTTLWSREPVNSRTH